MFRSAVVDDQFLKRMSDAKKLFQTNLIDQRNTNSGKLPAPRLSKNLMIFRKKATGQRNFVGAGDFQNLLHKIEDANQEELKSIVDSRGRLEVKKASRVPSEDSQELGGYTQNVHKIQRIGDRKIQAIRLKTVHRKLVDFYKKLKEDELRERNHLFPVKPQDESSPSVERLSQIKSKAKKKSLRKQLRIYDENFCIAMTFVNALNKSLFLLANDKHKMPKGKDFELENTISLGDLNKAIYDYCEFIDVAPLVFQRIRFYDGISNEDFIRDIGYNDFKAIFSKKMQSLEEEKSTGKSGSVFFQSSNGKYFIKTIRDSEVQILKKTLPKYFAHLELNPHSLLSRYYGLHKLRFFKNNKLQKSFFLVIMNNVFHDGATPIKPDTIFDLKGSTYKRRTSEEKLKLKAAGKDLNFTDMINAGSVNMKIGAEKLQRVLEIISRDSKFLAECNIIDYR